MSAHSLPRNEQGPRALTHEKPPEAKHHPEHDADRVARELKRTHNQWRVIELNDRIKFFNDLEDKGLLVDTYRTRRDKGQIPTSFDFRTSTHKKSDEDAAHAWQKFEIAAAKEIVRQLEAEVQDRNAIVRHEDEGGSLMKPERHEIFEEDRIAPPTTEDIKPPNKNALVIDASEIMRRMAWSQAEEKLNEITNSWRTTRTPDAGPAPTAGKFGRFWHGVKNVGKNIGYATKDAITHPMEFFRNILLVRSSETQVLQKFYQEILSRMQTDKNLYAEISARAVFKSTNKAIEGEHVSKHHEALDNIIEQFCKGVAEAEEHGEVLSDADVNLEVGNLFYEYATGAITDRAQFEARVNTTVIPLIRAKNKKFHHQTGLNEDNLGHMHATNFFALAESYKAYINQEIKSAEQKFGPENKEIIRNHVKGLMALDIQLGLKERDIHDTKPRDVKTWSTKLVDRLQTVPVLGKVIALPITWSAGAVAVSVLALKGTSNALLRTVMSAPVLGGLFGGLMGAWRRGRDLEYDRGLEMRREALGQAAGGRNAEEVRRQGVYQMLDMGHVCMRLDNIIAKKPTEITPEDREYVADVYARQALEPRAKVALFRASTDEGSRLGMSVKSKTEMKVRLRAAGAAHADLMPGALQTQVTQRATALEQQITAQDKNYASFRRTSMLKAGAFAGVVGVFAGALGEAAVLGVQGKYDSSSMGQLTNWMQGRPSIGAAGGAMAFHPEQLPRSGYAIRLPQNATIRSTGGNGFDIIDKTSGQPLVTGLETDAAGKLTPASLAAMNNNGLQVQNAVGMFENRPIVDSVVPGRPDVVVRLPQGVQLVPAASGGPGFDLIDTQQGTTIAPNVDFDINGHFTPPSVQSLDNIGWDVNSGGTGNTVVITDPNKMVEYLRQKYSGTTDPTSRTWHSNKDARVNQVTWKTNPHYNGKLTGGYSQNYPYDYKASATDVAASEESVRRGMLDTPITEGQQIKGTLVDGKEWRVHLIDKPTEYVLDFKGLREMLRSGAKNWDGTWDHKFGQIKHLLKSGNLADASQHFHFRFYANKADFAAGKAFSLPIGPDGGLHIPKGSELADLLINSEGKLKMTGETALYKGGKLAHIFATKLGDPLKSINVAQALEELVPTPGYVATPTIPDNFFMPLPFVPRWAMEKGEYARELPPIGPYGYDDVKQEVENLRMDPFVSPTLKENPGAKLQADHEISRYLNLNQERREELESFDRQLGEPMDSECEMAVCIPCASHMEGKNIYHTLEEYAKQESLNGKPLDPKRYEIIIFLNRPKGKAADESESEVERFKQNHPHMKIRVMRQETDWGQTTTWGEKINIGSICRRIYDLAALRSLKRGTNKDLTIFMSDADTLKMSPKLLAGHMETFGSDKEQKIDAVTGDVDWGKELMRDPNLFALTRIWQGLQKQIYVTSDISRRNIPSWGANFAMRASSYSAIGGRRDSQVSDLRLGRMIIAARRPQGGKFSERAFPLRYDYLNWLDSNPRRYVLSYKREMNAEDYPADVSLDKIIGPEQPVDAISHTHIENSIKQCVAGLRLDLKSPNTAKNAQEKKDRIYCREILKNTCDNIGIGCKVDDDGTVHVTSLERFKRKLQRARSGVEYFESMPGGKQDRKQP